TPISVTVTDGGNTVTATTYQWQVSSQATGNVFVNATGAGATTATYTPTESDEGGLLQVLVTYADATGTESATSNTSTPVFESPDLVATLDSTTVTQGTPVHVTVTDGGSAVTAASYAWQVSHDGGTTFASGTGTGQNTANYTPSEGDEGGVLRVQVTYN